ncbi:MAG: amino acid racemase [Chloroflexota bacterium]
MKTVGIIGGIAPESTVQYYRLIIDLYREKVADGSYPPILINSIDMTMMLDLIGRNKFSNVTEYLVGEVEKLAKGGADFGFLASNTPHIVFDEVQRNSPMPLISIVEAARSAVEALGLKKVGLFGTRFTMQGQFYVESFAKSGITVITPDIDDQTYIHDKYMSELVNGVFLAETRDQLLTIVDKLRSKHNIEGLVLGGTELPLILPETTAEAIPFFDTTKIHAEQAVTQIFS